MHLPTAVASTVVNKTEKGRSDWLEDIIMNVATEPSDTIWEDGSRRISMSGNGRDLQNKQFHKYVRKKYCFHWHCNCSFDFDGTALFFLPS